MAVNIDWSDEARADVRALERPVAMTIFEGLLRYARTGHGDVKALHGEFQGRFRLRLGDYRVIFSPIGDTLRIYVVKHRREAYRH